MSTKWINPPVLNPDFYKTWKRELTLWSMASTVPPQRKAPVVFLTLEGKAREAVLETDINLLNTENGLDILIEKLDTLFLQDENTSAFNTYENFEKFERDPNGSIQDYLIQFNRNVAKLREYKICLPEPVLAYRALKSANLSVENESLVKATIGELTLKSMSQQLKKINLVTSTTDADKQKTKKCSKLEKRS